MNFVSIFETFKDIILPVLAIVLVAGPLVCYSDRESDDTIEE